MRNSDPLDDPRGEFDDQNQSNHGDGNQQVQAGRDVTAPVVGPGGFYIGDGNSGITITSVASDGQPKRTFNIKTKMRLPTPASVIGVTSGVLTIVSFVTGYSSVTKLFTDFPRGDVGTSGVPSEAWWLLGSLLILAASISLFYFWRFVRRHVLWVPKSSLFPAWAGLKEGSGRTYPYALRLSMKCPSCTDRKMRFKRVPTRFNVVSDQRTGRVLKRVPIGWEAMAVCSRYKEHNLRLDLADNDFDAPMERT